MDYGFKSQKRAVGKGLYYLFIAELLSFLSLINILGWIVSSAAALISIYALYTLMKAEPKYRTAFYLTGLNLAVTLAYSYCALAEIAGTPVLLLQCAVYVVNFLMVYFICKVTGNLLPDSNAALKERAAMVWKLILFSDLLTIARLLLADAPETIFTTEWMALVSICAAIAAGLLYLFFLWESQKALQK